MINDNNFIEELKNNNPGALEYVLDTFGDLIYKLAYMNLKSTKLSEECVNDVLFTISESITEYDYPVSKFKNWIASITQYSCQEIINKEKDSTKNIVGGESL